MTWNFHGRHIWNTYGSSGETTINLAKGDQLYTFNVTLMLLFITFNSKSIEIKTELAYFRPQQGRLLSL